MQLILIVGPYRSGTGNDPERIRKNMAKLESNAYAVYRKGHVPMIGEWVANPLMKLAGSKKVGDEVFLEMQYPISHRVLRKCDAILRIDGESKGADNDVELAKELGLTIYDDLNQIPDNETR